MKHLKYIALGILVGYLLPYIIELTKKPDITFRHSYEEENEEEEQK
jgi:hypothetical protein